MKIMKLFLCTTLLASTLFSCKKDDDVVITPDPVPAVRPDVVFYGLTTDNKIIKYNAKTAETAGASVTVTGLQASETLLSIDFRPATGQLYALGNSSRLYSINLTTGAATAQGMMAFAPALSGTIANIDFNPTVDRVRLVTSAGQNLRLNPETGTVAATDLPINGGASPAINSIAYTNNVAGASATELFDIDFTTKKLYKQIPPNDGALVEVGTLGASFDAKSGFDINADNSVVLATLPAGGVTKLYAINLTSAATTFYANITTTLIDIAIPTNTVAYSTTATNTLQIFNPATPSAFVSKTITGLGLGENILGIDMRPLNGQLYALAANATGAAKLYTINLSSGAAAAVGAGFSIGAGVMAVGLDFNPTVDRIRLVTNTGLNLRLNPIDGTIAATDSPLNPGTPAITGAAYTNNFAGSTATSLFVMDNTTLYLQNPPNAGTLVSIGSLGLTNAVNNGFDIGGASNVAYAILTVGTANKIYTINLTSGATTAVTDFPNAVTGMAVGLGF
jgi:hypothetical protein